MTETISPTSTSPKNKSKQVAGVLAAFFGGLGVHQFYLGRTMTGVVYLLFCWTLIPPVLGLIDCIRLVLMSQEDFDAKYNHIPKPPRTLSEAQAMTTQTMTTQDAIKKGLKKGIIRALFKL